MKTAKNSLALRPYGYFPPKKGSCYVPSLKALLRCSSRFYEVSKIPTKDELLLRKEMLEIHFIMHSDM